MNEPYFSAEEWASFQAEDIKAGRAVVGLMAIIFSIGLFLYLGIAFWVWGG